MGALQQRFGPSAERRVVLGDMGQRRSRAVDQQLAKISVASLADAKKLRSAAGGELTWDQTQPRRQVATVLESLALPDRRDQRRGNCRADARDGRQSTSVLILFCPANELGVKGGNPSIEFGPLGARVGDQRDHPRAQSRSALLV